MLANNVVTGGTISTVAIMLKTMPGSRNSDAARVIMAERHADAGGSIPV